MSVIRKIKVKNQDNTFTERDLGALSTNVKYNSIVRNEEGEETRVETTVEMALNECQYNIFSLQNTVNSNIDSISNLYDNIREYSQWKPLITAIDDNDIIELVLCELTFDNTVMPAIIFQNLDGISLTNRNLHFTKLSTDGLSKEEGFVTLQISSSNVNPVTLINPSVYITTFATGEITKVENADTLFNGLKAYAYSRPQQITS